MWFFLVITMLASGEVIKERHEFANLEACVYVQKFTEHNLLDLGGFIITHCEKSIDQKETETYP